MSLAIVTEVADRFRQAISKWNVGQDVVLESRFLLKHGIYIGHLFQMGPFQGRWLSEDNQLKIYRDRQWVMTVPLDLSIETVESRIPPQSPRRAA